MRVTLALNELNTLPWTLGLKREYITEEVCINTPWIQDVYWTYIRRSGDAQDVQLKIIPFFLICSGSPSGSFSWVRFGTLTILKVKFKSYSWTFCQIGQVYVTTELFLRTYLVCFVSYSKSFYQQNICCVVSYTTMFASSNRFSTQFQVVTMTQLIFSRLLSVWI